MKSLKAKWIMLSSVFLLSSFEVAGAEAKSKTQDPAEVEYARLLNAGDYDALQAFVDEMIGSVKEELDDAKVAEAASKKKKFPDEAVMKARRDTVINATFAVGFWSDRGAMVNAVRTASAQDKQQVVQLGAILPGVVESAKTYVQLSHEANDALVKLSKSLQENETLLKNVDGVEEIPKISFEKTANQVALEAKINQLQKNLEAALVELEQRANDNEAAGKAAAAKVERSSNSKLAKGPGGSKGAAKRKAAAAKKVDDSASGGPSDSDDSEE